MSKSICAKILIVISVLGVITACSRSRSQSSEKEMVSTVSASKYRMNMAMDSVTSGIFYDKNTDCFHISSAKGLEEFRDVVMGVSEIFVKRPKYRASKDMNYHVVLTADIDMSEVNAWQPIPNFTGTFDGQGYRIKNFHPDLKTIALFVYVGEKKTEMTKIKNLVIEVDKISPVTKNLCMAYVLDNVFMQDCSLRVNVPQAEIKNECQVALVKTIYSSTMVHTQVLTLGESYMLQTVFARNAHDVTFVGCMKRANISHDFIQNDAQSCVYVACVSQVSIRYIEKTFLKEKSESIAYGSYILPTDWEDIDDIVKKLNQGCMSWNDSRPDVTLSQCFYKKTNTVYLNEIL